jgi:hypothetical protein
VRVFGIGGRNGAGRRDRKVFFSEEKNQKTLVPGAVYRSGTWPESWVGWIAASGAAEDRKIFCFFSPEGKESFYL